MTTKAYYLIVILFFVQFVSVYAQKSFEPGYVIDTRKDTLRGFIDYKNWSKNPEKILFKALEENPPVTYGLSEIDGFYVHGETYVKAEVERDAGPARDEDLTYSPIAQISKTTAFLLVQFSGAKRLYYLKDFDGKIQFYIGNGPNDYHLLVNHRYRLENSVTTSVVATGTYKMQLKEFFADCPAVASKTDKLTYFPGSFENLFRKYYETCTSEKSTVAYSQDKFILEPGVLLGVNMTKLDFKGYYPGVVDVIYSKSYRPMVGLFLNIGIPRTKKRFSIYNELVFNTYESSFHKTNQITENYRTNMSATLGYSYLSLKNMVRYNLIRRKVNLFLNAGITNGVAITEKNKQKTETVIYNNPQSVSESVLIDDIRKYEQGWVLGIGASYKKLSYQLRYENSNGMSVYELFNSNVRRYSLIVSYSFK